MQRLHVATRRYRDVSVSSPLRHNVATPAAAAVNCHSEAQRHSGPRYAGRDDYHADVKIAGLIPARKMRRRPLIRRLLHRRYAAASKTGATG